MADLDQKIQRRYRKAYRDMKKKFLEDKEKLKKQDAVMKKKLKAGKITEKEYKKWRKELEKELQKDARKLSAILGGADQLAVDDINDKVPEEFANAENHETYEIERALNIDTNYTLVRKEDITKAMYGQFFSAFDKSKNSKWNQRRIRSAITQGIISGEGIEDIAKRLITVTGMNERSAIRNARLWVGTAVSAGHQEAANRAMGHGVQIDKWWDSVLDLRTRLSHRQMHRQHVPADQLFSNGAMYPRDPSLPPEERYNCRCQELYYPRGLTPNFDGQKRDFPEGFTEADWLAGKDLERKRKNGVVDGKDITDTWERRPDKFDFEIEDVINAQGFDGLPKVVDEDEFDRLVKESKFIAQRTYSAPDQETVDMYQKELYEGKWYVDCSTGGAQYGQGMYCAADYSGKLSDGILAEMQHYRDIGNNRFGMDWITFAERKEQYANKLAATWAQDYISKLSGGKQLIARYLFNHDYDLEDTLSRMMKEQNSDYFRWWDEVVKEQNRIDEKKTDITRMSYADYEKNTGEKVTAWSHTETLTLDKSAKIVDYDVIEVKWWTEVNPATGKTWQETYKDLGSFAAALGYDAINASGHGASGSYTVILNRTKVIFKRSKR